jgi:hypothetical protein
MADEVQSPKSDAGSSASLDVAMLRIEHGDGIYYSYFRG